MTARFRLDDFNSVPSREPLEVLATNAATKDSQDGTDLFNALAAFVCRFVVLGVSETVAITLWVAHTWALDAAEATPYLSVTSVEKASGKTRLLEVVGLLVREPLPTVNISDAALFRKIAASCPTVLMDETDAVFGPKARDREDLRGLLNSGYTRGGIVYRMGGAKMTELQSFETFSPKLLAGIGDHLPDTLVSRSIPVRMKRRTADETIERFRLRDARVIAEPLRDLLASWAVSALPVLQDARPALPDELGDRAQDVWEPLLAIADLAGGDWPAKARVAAIALMAGGDPDDVSASFGVRLLADIRRAFEATGTDRLLTARLVELLAADEEAPWGDWHGRPFSGHSLARLLKPYLIRPKTIRVDHETTGKGYHRDDFADAWERYLPLFGDSDRNTVTTRTESGIAALPDRDTPGVVTVVETGANPHGEPVVTDVTVPTPIIGDEGFRDVLNRAFDAGQITHQERRERRILHCLVVRTAWAA